MADRIVHGFAVGVRDVPRAGLVVRIVDQGCNVLADLTPEQAGELAEAVEQAGIDAIRETGRRRTSPDSPPT